MTGEMVVQGRELSAGDIGLIQGLLAEHPEWGRTRLSEELCRSWDWRNTQGRTRNDRNHRIRVSVKDVYLYPLSQGFRRELCAC